MAERVAYAQMRLSESESANGTKQIFFWWDTFRLSRFMDNLKGYDMPKNYTLNVLLDAGAYVLDVNVDPNTCFDDRFKAWCNDENELLVIDGWNVAVIEVTQ